MPAVHAFHFLFFSQLMQLLLAANGNGTVGNCPSSFDCGNLSTIHFPFTSTERANCGILAIHGCDDRTAVKSIQLNYTAAIRWFNVVRVSDSTIFIRNNDLLKHLISRSCETFSSNYSLPPSSPLASFDLKYNITLFRCNRTFNITVPKHFLSYTQCPGYNIYYSPSKIVDSPSTLAACSRIQLPVKGKVDTNDPFTFLTAEVPIEVRISDEAKHRNTVWKLALGIGIPGITILMLILWCFQQKYAPPDAEFQSSHTYAEPDPETSSVYFGVPVFSYKELEEATNNFDRTRELGTGGFGTVYYGKLRDGREVAVKCLYEHNYKRVEQFMNEIEIIRGLRHRNLVSLYGCTSHQSRELLLVYEYTPNGTVASHLHGDLAKPGSLPWPIRMNISIETASALAYLHASDIIHRDVKTSNILVDNNFCVKVADFGLSRLFPIDVTHVTTAPQGTPGYVDPEYYRCYQLTDKSDVYSFGVVLIELMSSMSPVDLNRHRDEVNLADLAVKKIQKSEFSELVDPSLGYKQDSEVKGMINSMAELAFQCLQWDKELRPSMDQVLEVLRRIKSGKDEPEREEEEDVHGAGMLDSNVHPPSPDCDEVGLLKITELPSSPSTVTHKWESGTTTPNFSG